MSGDINSHRFDPDQAADTALAYRSGTLKAFARRWEADDRQDVSGRFWDGLAGVLAATPE